MSVIVLSFNYYDANTFTFHFAQFPFSFITTDPQCLQFFVSLRMIFYSYSPHLKGICNFAWLVIRLLLVWCKRKISLWISVSANKPIYIFILMRKTVRCVTVHAEEFTVPAPTPLVGESFLLFLLFSIVPKSDVCLSPFLSLSSLFFHSFIFLTVRK